LTATGTAGSLPSGGCAFVTSRLSSAGRA